MRKEFDTELAMESVYGMSEDAYAGYNEYLDGSDLDNLNRDEADDYRDEGYGMDGDLSWDEWQDEQRAAMDDYEPSDEDDMYGGFDDFDEYMSGE